MNIYKMKVCRVCGGDQVTIVKKQMRPQYPAFYMVSCKCGNTAGPFNSPAEAARFWNKRDYREQQLFEESKWVRPTSENILKMFNKNQKTVRVLLLYPNRDEQCVDIATIDKEKPTQLIVKTQFSKPTFLTINVDSEFIQLYDLWVQRFKFGEYDNESV